MMLVDHPGSGWSGSSVVARICYHHCYQVVIGTANRRRKHAYRPDLSPSEAHLLLHLLVDPDPRVDRAGADGARAQLPVVVLHPRPLCGTGDAKGDVAAPTIEHAIGHSRNRGSSASRNPSPRRLKPSTTS